MEGQDASPILYVNGKRHVMPAGQAEVTLLAYLRGASASSRDSRHHFFWFFFLGTWSQKKNYVIKLP
jgi:hypothetical protein